MTRRLFFYLLLLFVCYLTMNYSQHTQLLYLLFALCLLPLFSLAYLIIQAQTLRIHQRFESDQKERDTHILLYIEVERRCPLPLFALELETRTPPWPEALGIGHAPDSNSKAHAGRTSARDERRARRRLHWYRRGDRAVLRLQAAAFEEAILAVAVDIPHHGRYQLGIERAHLEDPLGFFRFGVSRRLTPKPLQLNVLPLAHLDPACTALIRTLEDEQPRLNQQISTELDEVARLRPYRPGDSLKLIHWSVSSHLRQLQVREFALPQQPASILLVEGLYGSLDQAIRWQLADLAADTAASLSTRLCAHGQHLRLYLPAIAQEDLVVEEASPEQRLNLAAFALRQTRILAHHQLESSDQGQLFRRKDRAKSDSKNSPLRPSVPPTPEGNAGSAPVYSLADSPHLQACFHCLQYQLPQQLSYVYLLFLTLEDAHVAACRQLVIRTERLYVLTLQPADVARLGLGSAEQQAKQIAALRSAKAVVLELALPSSFMTSLPQGSPDADSYPISEESLTKANSLWTKEKPEGRPASR